MHSIPDNSMRVSSTDTISTLAKFSETTADQADTGKLKRRVLVGNLYYKAQKPQICAVYYLATPIFAADKIPRSE